ncbi:MAG: hypothetical protein QOH13_1782, partial [Thermoleophilaceae bacterium]|nr:hypothetical protein [Thermoleophilaceae bacterium]
MKILVTTSRTPFGLDLIRKLGEAGHEVDAADSYAAAPGSHSKFVAQHHVTPSAQDDAEGFVAAVAKICADRDIELIVPTFEEVFYLSALRDQLGDVALFAAEFRALAQLHDKATFQRLAQDLDLPIPATVVARNADELHAAIEKFPDYFARAAFSRGGVSLLTNTGPLAGHVKVEDVTPTDEEPWLVQEYVDGPMLCSYSTVHGGKVTAHMTYRAPRQWQHSTGIQFESIDGQPSLAIVQRIVSHLDYTGQISFDFVDSPDRGLQLIECNPRTTDGVLLMDEDVLSAGISGDVEGVTRIVEPGRIVQLDFAVLGQMFLEPLHEVPKTIHDLAKLHGPDRGWHDLMP